jgi:hypothetical protein
MRRALVLLLLLPVAAGCGAKQSGELESVDNAMAKAGTSRVEMKLVFKGQPRITAEGTFDYTRNRGHMVMKPADPRYEGSFPYEGRFIGRTTYSGWMLLGKKRWLKETDYRADGIYKFFPGPDGPRPDDVLARILKSSKRVETLGEDEIRGAKSKHYRAHLDLEKLGGDENYSGYPGKDLVIDVWVDDDGLVRRLQIPFGGDAPEYTLDFFDYGVATDIEPPSDDELVTQEELDKLIAAECKQRKEHGKPWDESECTRDGVVEGDFEEIPPTDTVIKP